MLPRDDVRSKRETQIAFVEIVNGGGELIVIRRRTCKVLTWVCYESRLVVLRIFLSHYWCQIKRGVLHRTLRFNAKCKEGVREMRPLECAKSAKCGQSVLRGLALEKT